MVKTAVSASLESPMPESVTEISMKPGQADLAARIGVLGGVREQVRQHLRKAQRIRCETLRRSW
jgi:hypothetical protein